MRKISVTFDRYRVIIKCKSCAKYEVNGTLFPFFRKAKSTRRWKIEFRGIAKYCWRPPPSTIYHFQQKCLFHREYRTKFKWIWFPFWGAWEVSRCQRCHWAWRKRRWGPEIENVCTVRRRLAIAGSRISCPLRKTSGTDARRSER